MAKRDYYLIIDSETTMTENIADFGAIVVDKKGKIYTQAAILIDGIFTDMENHPLFHNYDRRDTLWGKQTLQARYDRYNAMVAQGSRMLAKVPAVNRWLAKVNATYSPIMTAYNLPFDVDKMRKTGIDCDMFAKQFCLWHAAFNKWGRTKEYRNFALQLHAFNPPTKLGNMSFKTNAETMARFVTGNPAMPDEPHTALEDALDYELPILLALLKSYSKKDLLERGDAYDWRKVQVKDWFQAK